jgi:hypothetical protein
MAFCSVKKAQEQLLSLTFFRAINEIFLLVSNRLNIKGSNELLWGGGGRHEEMDSSILYVASEDLSSLPISLVQR